MLSEQQNKLRKGSPLGAYRKIVAGSMPLYRFVLFELVTVLFKNTPGALGIVLRKFFVSPFLKFSGAVISDGVSIKQPDSVFLDKGVIIDSGVSLDVRESELSIGKNVYVGKGTILAAKGGKITLGEAVNIGSLSRIATQTSLSIGEATLIGAYCYIGPGDHKHDDPSKPISEQGMELKDGVSVGKNCWLGARVTVVDGVKIGDNCIIGAHSFVNTDIPDNSIAIGVPAKVVKTR